MSGEIPTPEEAVEFAAGDRSTFQTDQEDGELNETPLYIFPIPPELDLLPEVELLEIPLSGGEAIRVEKGTKPHIGSTKGVEEIIEHAKIAGQRKGEFDQAKADLTEANSDLTTDAEEHIGIRGAVLPAQGRVVEVNPKRTRKVRDADRFKKELGPIFSSVAKDKLHVVFTLSENLADSDGNPITIETYAKIIFEGLKSKGLSRKNVVMKREIDVNSWEDVAMLIRAGKLSVATLEASTTYEVRVDALERTQGSRPSRKTRRLTKDQTESS